MIEAETEAQRRKNWQFACTNNALSGFETPAEHHAIMERYFKDEISLAQATEAIRQSRSQRNRSSIVKQSAS